MKYETSSEHLAQLVAALQRPAPQRGKHAEMHLKRIADEGWAHRSTIEDLLLEFDGRLDPYEVADSDTLVAMFRLHWQSVTPRPHKRSSGVMLFEALDVFDVAALLINLEMIGFNVDPEPLIIKLLPTVARLETVTERQLSIFWYSRQRHRGQALVIKVTGTTSMPFDHDPQWKTSTGYRVQPWRDREEVLIALHVHAPKFRRRPEPIEVTCPECGVKYSKGDFDSGVLHRREHRARMRYLDPQPHSKWSTEATVLEPELVTFGSPVWKHHEMYERALAFKREFRYDFVQWGSRRGDDDSDAHGFLFRDDRGAIVGACAFRLRQDEGETWWGLQWIWICPRHRRQGHLARRWAEFRRRFGEFVVEAPVSEAMHAFLASQGDEKLAISDRIEST